MVGEVCGANRKKNAGKCKARPVRKNGEIVNGRCKFHGGMSTGAPKGNTNNRKHGIYTSSYTKEELEHLDQDDVIGNVDNELKLLRVSLNRCVLAEIEWNANPDNANLPVEEIETSKQIVNGKEQKHVKIKRKKPDFQGIQSRLIGRINSLENTKLLIGATKGDVTSQDIAEQIRSAALNMELLTNGAE